MHAWRKWGLEWKRQSDLGLGEEYGPLVSLNVWPPDSEAAPGCLGETEPPGGR
jgi:hypothetical protein